jgi:hypothetical protein
MLEYLSSKLKNIERMRDLLWPVLKRKRHIENSTKEEQKTGILL